jgi:hypothetical protein
VFLAGYFRLFHLRGFGFLGGAFKIQSEQFFQNLFVRQIGWPAVGGGDGGIQFLVREIKPRGTFVVKFRERALFQLGGAIGVARFKAGIADEAG